VTDNYKHSSLLQCGINYFNKKSYCTGPYTELHKRKEPLLLEREGSVQKISLSYYIVLKEADKVNLIPGSPY